MNINFNEVTYECLKFLATKEGKSVAAYVAQLMDEHTGQMVNLTFTMNEVPAEARIIQHDESPYPGVRENLDFNRLENESTLGFSRHMSRQSVTN